MTQPTKGTAMEASPKTQPQPRSNRQQAEEALERALAQVRAGNPEDALERAETALLALDRWSLEKTPPLTALPSPHGSPRPGRPPASVSAAVPPQGPRANS